MRLTVSQKLALSCVLFLCLSVFLLAASVQESRAEETAVPIEGITYFDSSSFYFYECGKTFPREGERFFDTWVLEGSDDALALYYSVSDAAETRELDETYISGKGRLIYVENHMDNWGNVTGAVGVAQFESLSRASMSHDLIERCVKGPTGLLDGLK
jgi:hypothetical protein